MTVKVGGYIAISSEMLEANLVSPNCGQEGGIMLTGGKFTIAELKLFTV